MIDYKREEEREQEEYEEYLAERRWQERKREEQAEEDYWFQKMQHEQDIAKQAESYYAEQAQFYYLALHVVHILRRHLNAITEKQEEEMRRMRTFSEMDKHYDRHNDGICAVCGCTTWSRWKSVCNACRSDDALCGTCALDPHANKRTNEKIKKGDTNE